MSKETVLITGASSGIGLELARFFAADGSDLVLVARTEEALRKLATDLGQKHGIQVRVLPKDLTDPKAPAQIYEELTAAGVNVDVVVNNAGFGAMGTIHDLPLKKQQDMIQVNVTALTELTRLFLPGMVLRKRGGILNVASTASFQPGPNQACYFATKAFVLSYTEGLAEELSGTGVVASCLCPGATVTNFGAASGMEETWIFKAGAMDAVSVARQGHAGFRAGRVIVITGFTNFLGTLLVRIFPRFVVRKVVHLLQK
jgi:short-subunit dehydrogenase